MSSKTVLEQLPNSDVSKLLEAPNSVLIGSRGLDVHTDSSDYDIAILWKDLPTEYSAKKILDIRKYFNMLPMGNSGLLKLPYLDVLLFENIDDLNIIKEAKRDLLTIPKYLLENRRVRIDLFEIALQHYGFTTDVLEDEIPF